jgi:membrane-bound ClpP family serine protease
VHVTDIERLIPLERATEEARARLAGLIGDEYDEQWRAWFKASEAVQAAITEHATESGRNRYEVEQAVKAAVRHAEEDPAG